MKVSNGSGMPHCPMDPCGNPPTKGPPHVTKVESQKLVFVPILLAKWGHLFPKLVNGVQGAKEKLYRYPNVYSPMAEWENPVYLPCTLSNTCMHGEVVYKQGRSGKVKCAQFCFSRGDPLRHRQPFRFQADVMDDLLQRARGTWVELIKQSLHDHVQDPAQAVDVIAHSISGSQA